jgi:hypothetical protein
MKIHIRDTTHIPWKGCKFGCDRSIIKDTLRGQHWTYSSVCLFPENWYCGHYTHIRCKWCIFGCSRLVIKGSLHKERCNCSRRLSAPHRRDLPENSYLGHCAFDTIVLRVVANGQELRPLYIKSNVPLRLCVGSYWTTVPGNSYVGHYAHSLQIMLVWIRSVHN